jgi:hypothetical protein
MNTESIPIKKSARIKTSAMLFAYIFAMLAGILHTHECHAVSDTKVFSISYPSEQLSDPYADGDTCSLSVFMTTAAGPLIHHTIGPVILICLGIAPQRLDPDVHKVQFNNTSLRAPPQTFRRAAA